MLKIWGRATSINVQKVMWTVAELGLEHERIDAGGPFGQLDTDAYAALNPNRLVPVIQDKGFVLWESNAIVRHLAQKYGRGSISPNDEENFARADQWMDWSITTIYRDLIMICFLGLVRTAAKDRNPAEIKQAAERVGRNLTLLDRQLGSRQFVVGLDLSIADIALGSLMYRYYNIDIARPRLVNVEAWYERLTHRPAYRDHVMVDFASLRVPGA